MQSEDDHNLWQEEKLLPPCHKLCLFNNIKIYCGIFLHLIFWFVSINFRPCRNSINKGGVYIMKKKFLLIVIVLIFTLVCLTVYSQDYDFRKTIWGMTKDEVKSTENNEIIDEDLGSTEEVIVYKDQISSFDCFVGYIFVENKLASAGYYINEEHSNKNAYIDDYEKLKDLLSKKYGNPIRDDVIWRDDLYKEDKVDWGLAISIGDLTYQASWETPTTEIELLLSGDNYNIELVIKYVSKELKDWAKEVVKEDTLQDL